MISLYVLDHRQGHSEDNLDALLLRLGPDRDRIVPKGQAFYLREDLVFPDFQSPAVIFVHRGSIEALEVHQLLRRLNHDIPGQQFYVVYYSTESQEVFSEPRVHPVTINESDVLRMSARELAELADAAMTVPLSAHPRLRSALPTQALATYLCQLGGLFPVPAAINNGLDADSNRKVLKDYFER